MVTRGVGPRPGEPATSAAPTNSTPGEEAAHTQVFLARIAPILTSAQQQIYSLQGPFPTFVLDDLAAAARLSDGRKQFTAIHDQRFSEDPLREYMLAFLNANIVPPYMGSVDHHART